MLGRLEQPVTITVTEQDIDWGNRSNERESALSLAIKRAFHDRKAFCYRYDATTWSSGEVQHIHLPVEALWFQQEFLEGKDVKPFCFTVDTLLFKES